MSALSLFPCKGALGICVFERRHSTFRLISCWNLTSDFSSLCQLTEASEVQCILCPPSLQCPLSAVLPSAEVAPVSNGEFRFEDGKAVLMAIWSLETEMQFETRVGEDLKLAVCAFAPLYQFALKSASGPFQCEVGSSDFLSTDMETLRNLQLIKDDFHPSTIKSAGRSKEGFSVFSLLDKTVTKQGRRLLRQWVLQPLQCANRIRKRLEKVTFFAMNPVISVEIHRVCKEVCDLEKVLSRFSAYTEKGTDWSKVAKSLRAWESICRLFAREQFPLESMQVSSVPSDISTLSHVLETSFDLSLSVSSRFPSLRPGVCPELDSVKQSYEDLEGVLTDLARVEAEELGVREVGTLGVVYFPQLGYLVELKARKVGFGTGTSVGSSPEDFVDQIRRLGYEFQFRTEEAVFYKSSRCRELDEQFGDLVSIMRDIEGAEVRRLEEEVLRAREDVVRFSRFVGELDALISLATAAGLYNWSCPELSEKPGIAIVNGRHPLVELCVAHFIPNDSELTSSQRLGLITGPNNSGKSVYLKMVGIIVYLAHCGSFVPAESAVFSVCDRIFTRMNVRDGGNLSAFTQELKRLAVAINGASEKSLLLFDELGKNTATEDGMALVYGTFHYFSQGNPPFLLLTTHYRELVTLNLLQESQKLRFFSMEMKESDEPVFLYKLIPGVPQSSLAFHCAKLAGVPPSVVSRAVEVRRRLRSSQ